MQMAMDGKQAMNYRNMPRLTSSYPWRLQRQLQRGASGTRLLPFVLGPQVHWSATVTTSLLTTLFLSDLFLFYSCE